MKYYKIKNIILDENKVGEPFFRTTDEPEWVKKEKWTRLITSQDALYTYVVFDESITNVVIEDKNVAVIVDKIEVEETYKKHFPSYYNKKELVTTAQQINIDEDISLKLKGKVETKFGVNWTGTYAQNITMADGDHCTGSVTVSDTYTWTINAGATIYIDGNYSLTANGKVTWVGTSSSFITIKSNLANASWTSCNAISFNSVNTGSAVRYVKIYDFSYPINFGTNTSLTMNNIYIENCAYAISVATTLAAGTNIISNSKITNCYQTIYLNSNNNAYILQLSNVEITNCSFLFSQAAVNSVPTVKYTNCCIRNIGTTASSHYVIVDMDDSLYINNFSSSLGLEVATTHTIDNSIICNFSQPITFANLGDGTITATDIIGNMLAGAGVQSGGGIVNCYVAGCRNYGKRIYDSGNAGTDDGVFNTSSVLNMLTNVDYISTIRTTRNFNFTPASILESALGENGVTISWTVGFKTKHRIKYGTTPGTYTMVAEGNYDWSNWDGLGITMTPTPSIALANLKAGTTYYYVVESYDWVFDTWVTSIEGDFTTVAKVNVNQLDIETNDIAYGSGDIITVTGNVKVNSGVVGATVMIQVKSAFDGSVIVTIMTKTVDFVANVAKSINTINGGALTWSTTVLSKYYVEMVVSGGAPAIDPSFSDLTVKYGFIVQDVTNITLPVEVEVETEGINVEVVV